MTPLHDPGQATRAPEAPRLGRQVHWLLPGDRRVTVGPVGDGSWGWGLFTADPLPHPGASSRLRGDVGFADRETAIGNARTVLGRDGIVLGRTPGEKIGVGELEVIPEPAQAEVAAEWRLLRQEHGADPPAVARDASALFPVTYELFEEENEDRFELAGSDDFAAVTDQGHQVWILALWVDPARRGRGRGTALLEAVLARYPGRVLALSADPFTVTRDEPAGLSAERLAAWYARHGFQRESGRRMTRPADSPTSPDYPLAAGLRPLSSAGASSGQSARGATRRRPDQRARASRGKGRR